MPINLSLQALGYYSGRWQALFEPYAERGMTCGRVVRSDRGSALVATQDGVVRAKPSVRLLKSARGPADLPAVGDWVTMIASDDIDLPLIDGVLERMSAIVRGESGRTSEAQVLAANVNVVFIVHPIADSPNLRRIERELSLAWESGAIPVVVLSKADLSPDAEAARSSVESVALGVDVLLTSALERDGIEELLGYLTNHRTAVLIGPSGAGKSTLVNALLGEERQATRDVRVSDGRGRHTTVSRELIQMPDGGVLIDTPGLRALGLTGSIEGIASAFPDIDALSASCRFSDCTHTEEPDCSVRGAVESGTLPSERLESYHKLIREAKVAAAKTDLRLRAEEERKWKDIRKASKEYYKYFKQR